MIQRTREGDVEVLAPEAPRDLRDLVPAAREALAAGARTLVVDLARAPALRGDDVERLADVSFACEKAKAALALAALSKEGRHVIEVLDLAALFPYVYPDREAALATLRRAAIAPAGDAPLEIGFDEEAPPTLDPPPTESKG